MIGRLFEEALSFSFYELWSRTQSGAGYTRHFAFQSPKSKVKTTVLMTTNKNGREYRNSIFITCIHVLSNLHLNILLNKRLMAHQFQEPKPEFFFRNS